MRQPPLDQFEQRIVDPVDLGTDFGQIGGGSQRARGGAIGVCVRHFVLVAAVSSPLRGL
jgi:hypothetical protein